MKGGISPLAPRPPKGALQSLPPILRIIEPSPTTGYSKAPRGLFVLPRVGRIFTASSISPSPSLRQRSSRYAIRAGRNLALSIITEGADYIFSSYGRDHFGRKFAFACAFIVNASSRSLVALVDFDVLHFARNAQHDLAKRRDRPAACPIGADTVRSGEDLPHDRRHAIHGPRHFSAVVAPVGSYAAASEVRSAALQDVGAICDAG